MSNNITTITTLNLGNSPVSFFNATPHAINLIADAEFVPAIRKYVGGTPLAEIPPSGVLLSAELVTQPVRNLGTGVAIARQIVKSCNVLPNAAREADFIIVSAMYATAYRQLYGEDDTPLLTIRDLVVESVDNPKPRGCRGFTLA